MQSTGRGTRPVRRNNECARIVARCTWRVCSALSAHGTLTFMSVAIWRRLLCVCSLCSCPEHDVKLLFVVCRCRISYVWWRQFRSLCKLLALRRWPWDLVLWQKSDCVSVGIHRELAGMDLLCSGKTCTLTQNIMTIELKLPWGDFRSRIVVVCTTGYGVEPERKECHRHNTVKVQAGSAG